MIDKNGYEIQVGDYVKTTNNWTYGNGNVNTGLIVDIDPQDSRGPIFILYPGKTKGSFVMAFRSIRSVEKLEDIDEAMKGRINASKRQFDIIQRDALGA